jgi:hypothetical protein
MSDSNLRAFQPRSCRGANRDVVRTLSAECARDAEFSDTSHFGVLVSLQDKRLLSEAVRIDAGSVDRRECALVLRSDRAPQRNACVAGARTWSAAAEQPRGVGSSATGHPLRVIRIPAIAEPGSKKRHFASWMTMLHVVTRVQHRAVLTAAA